MNHDKFIHMTHQALAASQELAMVALHAQTTPFHVVATLTSQVWLFRFMHAYMYILSVSIANSRLTSVHTVRMVRYLTYVSHSNIY